jgi:uncharacterized protein (TIGR03437 family)
MSFRGIFSALLLSVVLSASAQARNVFVAPGAAGTTVGVYSTDPFQSIGSVQGSAQTSAVYALASGKYYVVTGGSTSSVTTYNSSFALTGAIPGLGTITGSAMRTDGSMLAVVTTNGLKLIDTSNDLVVGNFNVSQIGEPPFDAAFSVDGSRLYVASSSKRTLMAINASDSPTVDTNVLNLTGGTLPILVSVAPNGIVYVSTQNRIYQIDGLAMQVLGTVAMTGNPGHVVFAPDLSVAMTVNQNPANGNTVIAAFDPATNNLLGTLPNSINDTLSQLTFAGPTNSGVRFYAVSTQQQQLYEIAYPNLKLNSDLKFDANWGGVSGITVSNEVTAPQYLFAADPAKLYRVAISKSGGTLSGNPIPQTVQPGLLFYGGPKSGGTASQILVYNGTQSVDITKGVFSQINIRVLDSGGRPLNQVPVQFSAPGITFKNVSVKTNDDGWAFATPVNPGVGGTYKLAVTAGAATASGTLSVTGGSGGGGGGGGSTGGITVISGQGQIYELFNLNSDPIIVQVTDASSKPVKSAAVTFTIDAATATVGQLVSYGGTSSAAASNCTSATTCTGVTDANGKVGVFFRTQGIGGLTYKQGSVLARTADGKTATAPVTVIGQTTTLTYDLTKPTASSITVPAGAKVTGAIIAKASVFDITAGGAVPLPNVALYVFTSVTDPTKGVTAQCSGSGGITLTDANGVGTCDLIAGGYIGTAQLTIQIGNRQYQVILNVIQGNPAHVTADQGNNQTGNPGQTLPVALRATVTDAGGNTLAGQAVKWTVGNANGVTLSNVVTTSDVNGHVSATATLGSVPGPQTVTVALASNANVSATFNMTVNTVVGGIAITGGNNQSVQANLQYPTPLTVKVTDSTGKALSGATVSFNVQGSVPVYLNSTSAVTDANGNAGITATAGANPGTASVVASVGSASTTFTLTVLPPGPVFGLGNLLNGASFQVQKNVAPGQILTITGTGVSNGAQGVVVPSSPVGPLPTTLNGVTVVFSNSQGAIFAPIYNVANVNGAEQVTVLVPFELQAGTSVNLTIKTGNVTSDPLAVPVVASAPGIFEAVDANNNHYAVVLHSNGSYVSPANPAIRGETLRYFVTSLGQTTPLASTTSAGVADQMVNNTLIVGVADAGVQVIGGKYVENFQGLYTVDFVVPETAPSGTQVKLNMAVVTSDGSAYYSNASSFAIQ